MANMAYESLSETRATRKDRVSSLGSRNPLLFDEVYDRYEPGTSLSMLLV